MTKKDEEKLVWRLSGLPTALEVRDLVASEIITKEEAKEILFKTQQTKDSEDELKSLNEQVEFLKGLVENFSQSSKLGTIHYTPYRYEFTTPIPTWTRTVPISYGTVLTSAMGGGRTAVTIQ